MILRKKNLPPPLKKRVLAGEIANKGLHNLKIFFYDETDSTNTRAKNFAECAPKDDKMPALFIARRQSSGRGRLGRRFESRGESGLWLSLLVYPGTAAPEDITVYAATVMLKALADTLPAATVCEPKIKWVNDLYLGGKKLAGILTEGAFDHDGSLRYAVCGMGINLYTSNLIPEIKDIATDIQSECGIIIGRAELAANIAKHFICGMDSIGSPEVAEEYKKSSFIIGKRVKVIGQSAEYTATAVDINERCALIVKKDGSGEIITLNTGEVSILPLK